MLTGTSPGKARACPGLQPPMDVNHRTELLEAFAHADAVAKDTYKGQTNQEG